MPAAEVWNTELDNAGKVTFLPRTSRLVTRLIGFGVFTVASIFSNVSHLRSENITGLVDVLRLTALAAFIYGTGLTTWQLVTRRPVITVDTEGITRGRTLKWSAIDRIEDPIGIPGARTVSVQPTDRKIRPLGVTFDNVEDLDAFAAWLRTVQARNS
ncbi:hypothetical protein HPO96_28055 [Kribbella sandramycini]|uniref:PH (Pleckstrin Homology) domain-containing protein n=1 Tax=Kribbella sandramycini TaxID=60450 RepID=A0A7Y4L4D0_9ACTN|nr:hypothetical protein [Kribbella sandramycini]MBB6571456.1 hypothetical protein [Kribbella sandramycini]NOL44107.1 hypothetical protein [Kribbella sandramycini]